MKSDYLIVGCTSAVGSRLLVKLLEDGYIVNGIRLNSNCKISSKNHVCESIDILNSDPRVILSKFASHNLVMASWVTTPGAFWESPLNFRWAQTYKNLMLEFKADGGSKIVGLGSCAEYKFESESALSESSITEPLTAYGKSKLEVYRFLSQLDLDFLWVRTFYQYGPEDCHPKFIASLLSAFEKNLDFELQDPAGQRDYVYIEDVVEILYKLIIKGSKGVFNIGTGNSISGYDIASLAHRAMCERGKIVFSNEDLRSGKIFASTEKLEGELGPIKWTDVESGIKIMIAERMISRRGEDIK